MKNRTKKLGFITNVALIVIFTAVFAVSFLPQTAVPMYGGSRVNAIYNGDRSKPNVSLMFNVYENTEIVNSIIDTLNEYNVKCTFFVGGCWADDNRETLEKIVGSGHEIANHGYFHKDHKNLNYDMNKQEIVNTSKIVKGLCGADISLFAPPSGSFSEVTLEVCYDLGYKVIMWSKDTIDWRDNNQDVLFKRATQNLTNGDLILMHPKPHTLKVLPRILQHCKDTGFNVVTVTECLG